jgi:hypothetical protein
VRKPDYDRGETIDDVADEAYDEARQEKVDAESDPLHVEALRRASGLSTEELFLEQVMNEGMTAGLKGCEASENPYQSDVRAHAEWERCRRMAAASKLAGMVA